MLQKVNVIGLKYVHFFQKEGTNEVLEIETTKEDYEQLATPQHIDPIPPNGLVWANSVTRKLFDTISGDLEPNQYADDTYKDSTPFHWVQLPGKTPLIVKPEQLTANGVTVDVKVTDEPYIITKG